MPGRREITNVTAITARCGFRSTERQYQEEDRLKSAIPLTFSGRSTSARAANSQECRSAENKEARGSDAAGTTGGWGG